MVASEKRQEISNQLNAVKWRKHAPRGGRILLHCKRSPNCYSSHSASCIEAHARPASGCVRMGSSTWSTTPSNAWLANLLAGGGREGSARGRAGPREIGSTPWSKGSGASDIHAFELMRVCFPPRLPARRKPPPTLVPVAASVCPSSDAASSSAAASLASSVGSAVRLVL